MMPLIGGSLNLKSKGRESDTVCRSLTSVANGPNDPHLNPESVRRTIACWTTSSRLTTFFLGAADSVGAAVSSLGVSTLPVSS